MYKEIHNWIRSFNKKLDDTGRNLDDFNIRIELERQEAERIHNINRLKTANDMGLETVEDLDQAIKNLNDEIFGKDLGSR